MGGRVKGFTDDLPSLVPWHTSRPQLCRGFVHVKRSPASLVGVKPPPVRPLNPLLQWIRHLSSESSALRHGTDRLQNLHGS